MHQYYITFLIENYHYNATTQNKKISIDSFIHTSDCRTNSAGNLAIYALNASQKQGWN